MNKILKILMLVVVISIFSSCNNTKKAENKQLKSWNKPNRVAQSLRRCKDLKMLQQAGIDVKFVETNANGDMATLN